MLGASVAVSAAGVRAIRRARRAEATDEGTAGARASGTIRRWAVLLIAYTATACVTLFGTTLMYGVFGALGFRRVDQITLFVWTMAVFVGLVGLGGLAWWYRGDRSRGRRRCPKCWYDMSGVPKREGDQGLRGWTCPECGRVALVQRRLFKTRRRRWRLVVSVILLFAAFAGVIGPTIVETDWEDLVPTTALIVMMPYLDNDSALLELLNERIVRLARTQGTPQSPLGLPGWQASLLESRAIGMFENQTDPERIQRGLKVYMWAASPSQDAVEKVRPFLSHVDMNVRFTAICAFEQVGGQYEDVEREVIAVLPGAQGFHGPWLVYALSSAAKKLGSPPPPPKELLQAVIDHPYEYTRSAARRVLINFEHTPDSLASLERSLSSGDEFVYQSIDTLIEMPDGRAIAEPALLQWLESDDPRNIYLAGHSILSRCHEASWLLEHIDKVPAAAQRLADNPEWSSQEENGIEWAFEQYWIWTYDEQALRRYVPLCLRQPALVAQVRKVMVEMGRGAEIVSELRAALETLGDSPQDTAARQAILAELKKLEVADADAVNNEADTLTTPSASP